MTAYMEAAWEVGQVARVTSKRQDSWVHSALWGAQGTPNFPKPQWANALEMC